MSPGAPHRVPADPAAETTTLDAAAKRRLLARLLQERESQRRHRLSPAQQRLWFMAQLQDASEPGSTPHTHTAWHLPAALHIEGPLDAERLAQAFTQVLQRHDVLRAIFESEDGEPRQRIMPMEAFDLPVDVLDSHAGTTDRAHPLADPDALIRPALAAFARQPFDLARGPLLRARLLRLPDSTHALLLCVHHIVADHGSLRILMRELMMGYAGLTLPTLPARYVDLVAHGTTASADTTDAQAAQQASTRHWQTALADPPADRGLPTDHPRPPMQAGRGGHLGFTLTPALSAAWRDLARRHQVSLFTALLAAVQVLIARSSGQHDVWVGSTVTNRDRPETRDLIGLFVNNLVLRNRIDPARAFADILAQVGDTVLSAFAHQALPFEQVVDACQEPRRLDRHPLFQIAFVLHHAAATDAMALPGLRVRPLDSGPAGARFDLALDMVDAPSGLSGRLEYDRDLFEPATIARLAERFVTLLQAIADGPATAVGDLPLMGPAETTELAKSHAPIHRWPEAHTDVAALFEAQAAQHPDAQAIAVPGDQHAPATTWTYARLQARVQAIADHLIAQGAQSSSGRPIGLCLHRGQDLPAAMLACLSLGLPYVPLDIHQPRERVRALLEQAHAAFVLIDGEEGQAITEPALPDLTCVNLRDVPADLDGSAETPAARTPLPGHTLAYIIFTSGTTGRPKGVPITHAALHNLLRSMGERLSTRPGHRWLATTPIGFDIAGLEMLLPLAHGAQLVMGDAELSRDGPRLTDTLRQEGITHLQATPSGWQLLVDSGWTSQAGLTLLCGGEALRPSLAKALLKRGDALWNLYGPTETTIWSTALRVLPSHVHDTDASLPIGQALHNTTLHVLDEAGRPLPTGAIGELGIGGMGLSPGYLDQPELSAGRFIAGSNEGDSERIYRTGDLVRRRADGLFDFLGRADHQIKLRGHRIEPAEIEHVLRGHDAVAQALVILRDAAQAADAQLVTYLVPAHGTPPDADETSRLQAELRGRLEAQLPVYMHPAAMVWLPTMPLSANGKVDRRALPAPEAHQRLQGTDTKAALAEAPATDTERALAALWADLLGQPVHHRHASFFELGGHSLLAARLMARLPATFGLMQPLPLRRLFEAPALSGLASLIDAARNDATEKAATHLDAANAQTIAPHQPDGTPRIPPRRTDEPLVLSAAQRRMWTLAQLEPDSPFYNIAAAITWQGVLDTARLRDSLAAVCARHDNLRSRVQSRDGRPLLCIEPVEALAPLLHVDTLDAALNDSPETLRQRLATEAARPFQLDHAPLLRLVHAGPGPGQAGEHVVMVVMHHILADAWSLRQLMQELVQGYLAGASPAQPLHPPLALQYADHSAWQARPEQAQALQAERAYWQERLAHVPPLLDLPTDLPRPTAQSFVGASAPLAITGAQRDALHALCYQHGTTPFMALLAIFQWLLSRYSGNNDIVVGTPIGHRPDPALDPVIGLFANTLALRTRLDTLPPNASFLHLLDQVRHGVLDDFAHQNLPFDQVIDALNVERHWRHTPLVQVMLLWQPLESTQPPPGQGAWQPLPLNLHTTKFDLTLNLAESPQGIEGRLEYRRDLFAQDSMHWMAQAFEAAVQAVLAMPSRPLARTPILPPPQAEVLARWNDTARPHDREPLLHELAAHTARLQPQAAALHCGALTLSHAELEARATALAAALQAQGIHPGNRVGVCLPRDADLLVALLAVLKTGAAYVPLDPAYPPHRLGQIAEDAGLDALLTRVDTQGRPQVDIEGLPDGLPVLDPAQANASGHAFIAPRLQPQDLAYLIYTSGSTGRPKGVAIEHRQAVAMVHWAQETFPAEDLRCVLAGTSICFDLSVYELFVPLASGGSVLLCDDVLALADADRRPLHAPSLINTVPTAATELVRLGAVPASVRTINLAGEPIPPSLVRDLQALPSAPRVCNLYGPSEDTTYSTGLELPSMNTAAAGPNDITVSIGRPIHNTRMHVLDDGGLPVPIGMPGELHLSGEGVARGYWQRPGLTAERFVPNPYANGDAAHATLYRTGDRVRLRPDGTLSFLGRIDQQVKVRGFRIELGEVEDALRAHPGVAQAVARAWRDPQGHLRLVANIVPRSELSPAQDLATECTELLGARLPSFMVPAHIGVIERLPLLPNGKLDRGALPTPSIHGHATDASDANGQANSDGIDDFNHPLERELATQWQGVLGRPVTRRQSHFFEQGGDSILAIQVVARLREAGWQVQPRDLFLHPRLADLAAELQRRGQGPARAEREPLQGLQPLTPAQRGFFELGLQHPSHWNQSILLKAREPLAATQLRAVASALMAHHDLLRARCVPVPRPDQEHEWHLDIGQADALDHSDPPVLIEQTELRDEAGLSTWIESRCDAAQASLDLQHGPLWRIVQLQADIADGRMPAQTRLLIVAHHLLVDGVSWRILLSDLQTLVTQALSGRTLHLPPRSDSATRHIEDLLAHAPAFEAELPWWQSQCASPEAAQGMPSSLPRDADTPGPHHGTASRLMRDRLHVQTSLDEVLTRQLLEDVPAAYPVRPDELMLAALMRTLREWTGQARQRLMLEGHGRVDLPAPPRLPPCELDRTVGWFTALHPLLLDLGPDLGDLDAELQSLRQTLRAVPQGGVGWGVLRHLMRAPGLSCEPELRFNYLGQTDALLQSGSHTPALFSPADEPSGKARHPDDPREVLLDLNALVSRRCLHLHWTGSKATHHEATLQHLADRCLRHLQQLIEHVLSGSAQARHVPADFPLMQLSGDELDDLLQSL